MLKKMVNGIEINLSDKEEEQTRSYWSMNAANPDYCDACAYDGLNDPYYDMEAARRVHEAILEKERLNKYCDINLQIEQAMDDGNDLSPLFKRRKYLRNYLCPDLTNCKTIDDLKKIKFTVQDE